MKKQWSILEGRLVLMGYIEHTSQVSRKCGKHLSNLFYVNLPPACAN